MVKLTDLKKEYKGFKLDITMEIPEGRVTGLIGRNGAGKTTTLKAILGLIKPASGEIEVLGKSPESSPQRIRSRSVLLYPHPALARSLP